MSQKISEINYTQSPPQQDLISNERYHRLFIEDFVNDLIQTLWAGMRSGTINLSQVAAQPATAADLGMGPRQATDKDLGISEGKYHKINILFEQYMAEEEAQGTLEHAIEEFFDVYIRTFGGDASKYQAQKSNFARQIAASIRKDQQGLMGKLKRGNNLSKTTTNLMFKLADIAYLTYRMRGQERKKAPSTAGGGKPPENDGPKGGTKPSDMEGLRNVLAQIQQVKATNPQAYAMLLNLLQRDERPAANDPEQKVLPFPSQAQSR